VLLLADEGEELGLLGARAFVADRARLQRIRAVVNLEARGTSGVVSLFELSAGNDRLVAAIADALPRPVTSSIFYFVYQHLPNDTDLTVFKRAGLAGFNLAFLSSPLRYHTAVDDLSHLDAGSVQQMGDQALAMIRALAQEPQWHASRDDVFFDLLAAFVVRWPEGWSLALALLAAALMIVAVVRGKHRRSGDRRVLLGAVSALGATVLALGLGLALTALLRLSGALPYVWVAHLAPLRITMWAAGALAVTTVAALLEPVLTDAGAWAGTWGLWTLLAVAVVIAAPAIAYPLLVPALVAGAWGVGVALRGRPPGAWAALPPTLVALVLIGPFGWVLPDALGAQGLPIVALLVGLALVGALPALVAAGRRTSLLGAAAALVALVGGVIAALVLPRFTADDPQPLALVLLQEDDAHAARWVIADSGPPLPPELARAAGFGAKPERAYPWPARNAFVAPGPPVALPLPELAVESIAPTAQGLHVTGRLRSLRGAPIANLRIPGGRLLAARFDGVDVDLPAVDGAQSESVLEYATLLPEGVPVELELRYADPVAVRVTDVQPGLHGMGDALLRLRPRDAVPIHLGDRSLVTRVQTLTPPPR
jgi:hypothetical protein